ncbi:hypothetical protein [Streptomyces arboris]|uniref:hypothetical protein n=1 Tax=Streptomyces arboris TaxID=2600619 RepID=UPI00363BF1C3
MADRRIPGFMKARLVEVGIPVAPRLLERVVVQSEAEPVLPTSRGPLYRLTEQADPDDQAEQSSFGVEPVTGTVHFVLPERRAWFANSGVGAWLDAPLNEPDGPEEYLSEEEEERALAEPNRLAEELHATDPEAFNGYEGVSLARVPGPLAVMTSAGRSEARRSGPCGDARPTAEMFFLSGL